jgi:ATP-dependent DNA helicase RecG
MRRLLQGDVGSGKTIVAAILLMLAVESGFQAALLAPTEILAEQHFATLGRLLGKRYAIALLTGNRAAAGDRRAVARGQVPLVVGTHALFQEGTSFRELGLLVIDEQHRFGVEQRQRMVEKGRAPDLLVMSATPIPRSLALTAYGDLRSVVLDELPPGRMGVVTTVVPASRRPEVYDRLSRELADGAQAYVVFPVIGESEEIASPALEEAGPALRQRFSGVEVAELHGRVPLAEREAIMERFRAGAVRLLLATTVIEVGVDVPGATAMVIEGAERFGLAQLHQLRGRVGRGSRPAWCTAIHGELAPGAADRLRAFARHADGFALAEADLALRGPGDVLGSRQAGAAPYRFADLRRDLELLRAAREDAEEMVRADRIPPRVLP